MSSSCELLSKNQRSISSAPLKQRTLSKPVSSTGIGLFSGEKVTIRLCPADADHGIVFQRVDLPNKPLLPATLSFVQGTPRCTVIGFQGVIIQTVEHILSALSACGIDNALIEIDAPELPIFDGSAVSFVEMIEKAGICEYKSSDRKIATLSNPVYWSQGDVHLIALPSDEFRVSYTLHYPHSPFLRSQFYSLLVNEEQFKKEIASCRTFCLYEEIAPMMERGLLKGGGLENGVIIKDNAILNPEGARFPDEMVRHKILDIIGDLSLMGTFVLAHVIAIRSGHTSNIAFAKELLNHITMENL